MKITPEQHDAFFRQGYFLVPRLFLRREIETMAAAFERLADRGSSLAASDTIDGTAFVCEDGAIQRAVWVAACEPVLGTFGADPRLVQPAATLLGSAEMDQLICQAHFKLPGDGVRFPWHQDSQNRGYGTDHWQDVNGSGSYVQTLIAVDRASEDNAPLQVVPGSACEGHLALNEKPGFEPEGAIPLLMAPGDTLFFHPYLIHGSGPNTSDRPRRVFINGFAHPGANSRTYPGLGSGRRLNTEG